MIKEMSLLGIDDAQTVQHWIFKHRLIRQDAKSQKVNKWLERNYQRLTLEHGDVNYKELGNIFKSLKFKQLYVKGLQKQKIIEKYIPHVSVINMEELGCPRLNQLCNANSNFPCCTFHTNLNPNQCTFYKVYVLKKWYVNNT
jgi:hypothetical protein